jgi:hypothetical protein
MQKQARRPLKVGDKVDGGTVAKIIRTDRDGSQLLEINTGRIGILGTVEIATVWDNEL